MFRMQFCRISLLVALALGACAQVPPPANRVDDQVDARQILWQRSLDDALALAKATGMPLFIAVNMDGESASDRIVHENYRDPAFVALTRRCVCLGASVFRHNARDHDDQGRRIICPRFGEITCGEHVALEPLVFDKWLADGERVAPRHALIQPDGKKAFDLSLCFDLQDIDRALAAAVAQGFGLNPGVTRANQITPPQVAPPPVDAAGAGSSDTWAELAARRDCRGRAALEAVLARVQSDATLGAALDAIAAHGDAGSLEALRVVAARMPSLPVPQCAALVRAGARLGSTQDWLGTLQEMTERLGAAPGDPGPDPGQRVLLQWLVTQRREATPAQLSFLLARSSLAMSCSYKDGDWLLGSVNDGPGSLYDETTRPHGGPVDLGRLLQTANAVARREGALPRPGGATDDMPEANALQQQLEQLDAEPNARREDPEWLARFAKASLDLGRRHIESGQRDAQLLLEDAARSFAKALAKVPGRYEWWIERARAAYFLQRFAEEVEAGRRAFAIAAGSEQLPADADLLASPVLQDARAIEALRWVGDGCARLLAERAGKGPAAELCGMIDGLRSLSVVAASPFGSDQDWVSFASFCGAIGLLREEQAVLQCGVMRYPGSRDLRQSLNASLWKCGRPELMPVVAEAIARAHAPSADAAWFCGYAWILAAEDARRCEDPRVALSAYDAAQAWFAQAAAANADYRDNCAWYDALAGVGQGMALAQAGQRGGAADSLESAIRAHRDLSQLKDGLDCDVLDLVDRILEWRADGPSRVQPLDLLDRLDKVASDDPFWAIAIADSALREALRADGRNPDRTMRDTVDAAGNKITMPMGKPTADGDALLRASIEAGRRAVQRGNTELAQKTLAQSLTIQAERLLERGQQDGVQMALAEAAPLLGLAPPAADPDAAALRACVQQLRARLGDARPRLRPGR